MPHSRKKPMAREGSRAILVCGLAVASWFAFVFFAAAADYAPGTPYTYLFDTNFSSPTPLTPQALAAKPGWTVLAEDDLAHRFQGDAVLMNDMLVLVVRRRGEGAEMYSQAPAGWKFRARLTPRISAGASAMGVASFVIRENSTAAVALTAVSQTAANARLSLSYGITTGQRIVEVRPGDGAERLLVAATMDYVVVPDLFGDDMVFSAASFDWALHPGVFRGTRLQLPTENMVLNLLDGGDAVLMCLWRSARQGAAAVLSAPSGRRAIGGCEVRCAKDASLWVALMEGRDIWHRQAFAADNSGSETTLDWKAPFPARWRCDRVRHDGNSQSWDIASGGEGEVTPPVPAARECPCRFEGNRAVVTFSDAWKRSETTRESFDELVVYPLDRNRTTPLTTFCPVDMLRNTLGVGPCQYILQTEGLAAETNPTPDQVMSFVEKQFEKKKEKQAAEQVKDLLRQMIDNVGHTQTRIDQYAAFAREVAELCPAEATKAAAAGAAAAVQQFTDQMKQVLSPDGGASATADRCHTQAAKLADDVAGLIGKENPLAECRRLGVELRGIGAVQDRTLSKCRMSVRWLKQQALMAAEEDPASAALAKQIETKADKVLQGK